MATKQTGRTHTKTIGKKPHTGRRYVQNGKVRIEWTESGKRRSRTVGPNTPEMCAEADSTLEAMLADAPVETSAPPLNDEPAGPSEELSFRSLALALLDAADLVADGIRNAARELLEGIASDAASESENPDAKTTDG